MNEEHVGIMLSVAGLVLMVLGVGILSSMVDAAATTVLMVVIIGLGVLGSGGLLLYRAVSHRDR